MKFTPRLITLIGILFWVLVLAAHIAQAGSSHNPQPEKRKMAASKSYGDNVTVTQTASKITIEIDAKAEHGLSKSEKTMRVASTRGNAKLDNGLVLGLNLYKYAEK